MYSRRLLSTSSVRFSSSITAPRATAVLRRAAPVAPRCVNFAAPAARAWHISAFPALSRSVTFAGQVGFSARRMFSSSANAESKGLIATYLHLLETKPILTKSVTSAVIALLGDVACQLFMEDAPFSVRRCFNMTVLGAVLVGPGLHFWYGRLAALIPGTSTTAVLQRLALDQFIWAPIFIALFFSSMSLLQGKPEAILPNLKQNVWAAMKVNWQLWPAANFINFKFVPVMHQVLFANFVALIWNTYLSWATSREVVVEEVTDASA